jgi:hypothetical protein
MGVRDGLKTPMLQSSRWQPRLDDGHARPGHDRFVGRVVQPSLTDNEEELKSVQ